MSSADLLDAQAAIEWAAQQLPMLQNRIERWANSYTARIAIEGGRKAYYLTIDPLPAIINAETGAIINSIDTSLDLLSGALAARNGYPNSKDVYFPIRQSLADFQKINIKELSTADFGVIARLRPYKGGNDLLYALRALDNTRKHRRLVAVEPFARGLGVESVNGSIVHYDYNRAWQDFSDAIPILHTDANAADCTIRLGGVYVAFNEPAAVVHEQQVVVAIPKFVRLANSIIALF
jgi:hypothetical protein